MDDNQVVAIIAAILYGTIGKQLPHERGDDPYTLDDACADANTIARQFDLRNVRTNVTLDSGPFA
jgi:hypothetical protein